MTDQNETEPTVESLLGGIEEMIEQAEQAAEGYDSAEEAVEHLDDIHDVADNVEDLLGTVDLTDLFTEVDWENLPEAIELGDVPDAIEERNPRTAVRLRKLLSVLDMDDVWGNVDAREFWRQSRELDDELDDLSEDGEEDETEDSGDEGFFSSDDDSPQNGASSGSIEGLGPSDEGFGAESLENAIQSRISESVQEFRDSILDARAELKQSLEENRDRSDRQGTKETNSRNPTAVSTLPSRNAGVGRATFSTVPEETRYSTAPNRRRIYGSRFEDGENDA